MTDRQRRILKEITALYIKTGTPISSGMLAEHLPFDLSAATVRLELARLENEGYITQPHVSSGSIPTPEAFREVFGNVADHETKRKRRTHPNVAIENITDAVPYLARQMRLMAFGYGTQDQVCIMGFQYLTNFPEFYDPETMSEFFSIVDRLSSISLENILGMLPRGGEPGIFIGSQNPFMASDSFGMVVGRVPEGQLLAVLGPLRMNYSRAFSLVSYLTMLLSKNSYGGKE